ncbi:GHKL domain-containing protein [Niabella sp. CC-SYL272]|uniref:sensor histidine kinase n=1 Tax=Niabella agricola TaxID=2891571 RepID=UPI001F35DAC7|nr:7TM diverse intracellular signaling domain-containing protein [Niabella agricola]MCF3111935.1 GHKL domain-containing protein [Niabella agricola]
MYKLITIFFFSLLLIRAQGQQLTSIDDSKKTYLVTHAQIEYLEDPKGQYRFPGVTGRPFQSYKGQVPNFFVSHSVFWLRIRIRNNTELPRLMVALNHPTLDEVVFYTVKKDGTFLDSVIISEEAPFSSRVNKNQNYLFNVTMEKGDERIVYIKLYASEQILVPIEVGTIKSVQEDLALKDLVFGLYTGLILAMFLYNFFLLFSTNDKSYFYYILYVLFVGLSQAMLQGYSFRFLWPNAPGINAYANVWIPFFNGIAAAEFIRHFLNLKQLSAKLNRRMRIIELAYCIAFVLSVLKFRQEAQIVVQFVAAAGSAYVLVMLSNLSYRKIRVAKFLLLAWTVFLCSVIIFVLRNAGLLPYNDLTYYALQIGSAAEAILLSLALADKINTYRREEELARKEALRVSRENEQLIKEQNIILEKEVRIRTEELQHTNEELKAAMLQIQHTQAKLVENEKMASLGQLTAGIAHEINNPINFVTSNIRPLEADVTDLQKVIRRYETLDLTKEIPPQLLDIEKYKKEIDLEYVYEEIAILLSGIKEGASRTSEIVKGLKSFARVDEANWKRVDINEGIDSTLLLVKNTFPQNFQLIKELGTIPRIECEPGKINQVIMNIVTNAIQAIQERIHEDGKQGVLTIKTWEEDQMVKMSIGDNGMGMTEDVKNKIFDPFFTTKDVGAGTGLGLAIVQGIIERHNGTIQVFTERGRGTTFVISLPVR